MSEFRNLILAVALSSLVMLGWSFATSYYYKSEKSVVSESVQDSGKVDDFVGVPNSQDQMLPMHFKSREDVLYATSSERVGFSNRAISGTINLRGAVIDDVKLLSYREEVNRSSPNVVMLSPNDTKSSYFIEFGWNSISKDIETPNLKSLWSVKSLAQDGTGGELTWSNGSGVTFGIKFELDSKYMFNISQYIKNDSNKTISLVPYVKINRLHDNKNSYWISHEGLIAVNGSAIKEISYSDMVSDGMVNIDLTSKDNVRNWFGFSDKYWFTGIIPLVRDRDASIRALGVQNGPLKRFQASFSFLDERLIQPKSELNSEYMMFVGAKELSVLDDYKAKYSISLFDKAVDFGSLYFITRPVFRLLQYIYSVVGNFGYAIICLTFIVKVFMVPLAYKSHCSVMKMKSLSPEMEKIKSNYAGNSAKINSEIAALFAKNSISPLSGFLPVLIQIPFFFALYKVLFVTIEMRHASFFWWIKDLSAPDPMNILNLFGLIDYIPPFRLGVLPVILGLTMILQQKMNESLGGVGDKNHAAVMKILPYIFMVIFSSFPAGLVIYWTSSNILTMLQQFLMGKFYNSGSESVSIAR